MISIVFSSFNEMNNPYLTKIISQFKNDQFFEFIYVDGGSSDGTIDCIEKLGIKIISLPNSTRAARLNLGIKQASHAHLLLQHPRSIIEDKGLIFLKNNFQNMSWAAFKHRFDNQHYFLKFISWYSNEVRVKKKAIVYLDHCIVVKKELLNHSHIPDIAIFEDTALSKIITDAGVKPILLPFYATTSAIRFLNRGIYKQFLLNQWIKFLYSINYNHQKINKIYEQKLNLNQNNSDKK
ncbi:MAG: glycosyltransferase [Legionellaceae bacterium]|nr:glycosyltransferase [Legionellaceae bacterium]